MRQNPAVSIIMPAYNAGRTIAASIKSVQAQTLQNWELIIVDDGSTDNTAQIVQVIAAQDSRICLIQRRNFGPSNARNFGASIARAQVFAFLDADDFWASERLTGMLKMFRDDPHVGVLFSRTRFVDAVTLKPGTLTAHRAELGATDLMAENALCSTSNIVCLKSVFESTGGFTPGLDYSEDQDWLLRVALLGQKKIRGVNAEWFFYRSASNSQSADLEAMRAGWRRMVDAAIQAFPIEARRAKRWAFGPSHRQLARRALRMGKSSVALRYLAIALTRDPSLIFRQPRRTGLTLIGTLISFLPHPKFKELVAR